MLKNRKAIKASSDCTKYKTTRGKLSVPKNGTPGIYGLIYSNYPGYRSAKTLACHHFDPSSIPGNLLWQYNYLTYKTDGFLRVGFFHHSISQNANTRVIENASVSSWGFQCNRSKIKLIWLKCYPLWYHVFDIYSRTMIIQGF